MRCDCSCLLVALATAVAGQIHAQSFLGSDRAQRLSAQEGAAPPDDDALVEGAPGGRGWDTPVDEDGTGNLIFESVGSLLQTWGNTRRRNGEYRASLARGGVEN